MIENLIFLAGGIAVLFAIISGYKYMNGSVSDDKEAGKKTIGYALAGCAIALLAWTTVSFAQIWSASGDEDMSIFTEEDGGENYEAAPAESNFEKETLEDQESDFEKEEGEASEDQESNSKEIEALEIEAISEIKDLVKISTDSIEEDESIDIKLLKTASIKLPEPTFINIGSSASSGFNNEVTFCGLNKNNEGKFGTAICAGSWKVNPCGWTSSCSTGWENAFIGDCVPDCKTEKVHSDPHRDLVLLPKNVANHPPPPRASAADSKNPR
ncbi:MAG: pilin [Patescibacteria group bacterium]